MSAEQDALIRQAADVRGTTVSDFAMSAILAEAHETLADRRVMALDDAAWTEFEAVLARPVQFHPNLAKLLAGPPVEDVVADLRARA